MEVPRFDVEVQACDNGTPQNCTRGTVYIDITDVNDNDPVFIGEYKDGTVAVTIDEWVQF